MNYDQALQFIHKTLNFGSKPGLSRVKELCERLGNPQDDLKFIHVAGTNGKGSTVTSIACALEDAGYTVGKYTSPYIFDFRERIEVCGEMIGKQELADITECVMAHCEQMEDHPTEFEIVTAIAFVYFRQRKCDYVVLEVGLGGRLDATNIIKSPALSVICSISLDHVDILGDTEEKIAYEKAGIIKQGVPCVVYPLNCESVKEVIRGVCQEKESEFICPDISELKILSKGNQNRFEYRGEIYEPALLGEHQIYNSLVAIEVLRRIGISEAFIKIGLSRVKLHGRYEVISKSPRIILDAGHNQSGIESLLNALKNDGEVQKLTVVFGMLKDKAYQFAIRELAMIADKMVCITPDSPRALSAFDMKNIAEMYCGNCFGFDDAKQATECALCENDGRTVLICGSFYIIDKVVKEINGLL